MAGDTVAHSVYKFIYIRVGGQILRIYPPLNKPKRCAQLIFNEDWFLNIVLTDSDFVDDMGTDD